MMLIRQTGQHRPNEMASMEGTSSIFHNENPSNFEPNKSFSIKSILDLPEESEGERAPCSSNSSSVKNCPVSRLPLVPRAAGPVVHNRADNVPPSRLVNWQDFGVAHRSYGALPFRNQAFPFGPIFPKKKRCPMRKNKQRPLFLPHQIQMMEKEFAKQRYISKANRARLASEINLTETQVRTWFQNRRTKSKKEKKKKGDPNTTPRCSQGEMKQMLLVVVNPFGALSQYCAAPLCPTFDFKGSFIA